ncbi:MAG TPA: Na+/H+ antiporter NhaA [Gemmatimonadaceae bacterium]|nr:Na+/H+ antiporter NhaA [Gemmatimonadaceae bacterium]
MTREKPAPIERVIRPFQEFAHAEASGGILLLVCAVAAVIWANSPWAASYFDMWETRLVIQAPFFALNETLHHLVNDGLMAVFFLLVGLEIKRELLVGELSSARQAALPIAAAIGGMLVPALIFAAFNAGTPALRGWGIPMATDIAFAIGVLSLVGSRVPVGLKVFLTALAIVDDMGAVLVIALFYNTGVAWGALGGAAIVLGALVALNMAGVRRPMVYMILGVVLWYLFLRSGVHATVAGVLLAMTIPARTRIAPREFLDRGRALMDDFDAADGDNDDTQVVLTSRAHVEAIHAIESAAEEVQAPLQRVEDALHGPVAFFIMPLFALVNAGVALDSGALAALAGPIALGVMVGLVIGKLLGILLFTWLAVRMGLCVLPVGASVRALIGVAALGGIGFTMSLFIAGLAFPGAVELDAAKVGILVGSVVAGVVGWAVLRGVGRGEPSVGMSV